MAVTTLGKNLYLPAPFLVPQNKTVLIDVEAEKPIDMFIFINDQELQAFREGAYPAHRAAFNVPKFYGKINLSTLGAPVTSPQVAAFPATSSSASQKNPLGSIFPTIFNNPPANTTWYLVIVNRQENNKAIAVYYRVYNT